MFAERVALWHKSSSFPSFASLSVNVVKGILAVIPTAGLKTHIRVQHSWWWFLSPQVADFSAMAFNPFSSPMNEVILSSSAAPWIQRRFAVYGFVLARLGEQVPAGQRGGRNSWLYVEWGWEFSKRGSRELPGISGSLPSPLCPSSQELQEMVPFPCYIKWGVKPVLLKS